MLIGIYDSGLGGLSVWRQLRNRIAADFLYFGDTAHVPYGEKTPEQLWSYFWEITDFMRSKGCEGVVVACNTASVVVLPGALEQAQIPVFGVIDGAVRAVSAVTKGRLGILATRRTVESEVYQRAFQLANPTWRVFCEKAPGLVSLVEQGLLEGERTRQVIAQYLAPLLAHQIDTLLLGCTHYPFLLNPLRELAGPSVRVVDPAPSVADLIIEQLEETPLKRRSETQFWVSSSPEQFRQLASQLLGENIPMVHYHRMSGEQT